MGAKTRILFVDDEPNILQSMKRQLRKYYDVNVEKSGKDAIALFKKQGPFPIIISDLQMPEMDGIDFLKNIRTLDSDCVRILLTGNADLNAAISSVNEGNVFRFLKKPCLMTDLLASLKAAEEQARLITAERVLLQQTLQGSIKALTEVLSLANPTLFAKASRLKSYVEELLPYLKIKETWHIAIAAMLSQLGYVTLSDQTIAKINKNEKLTTSEQHVVDDLPTVSANLLDSIPRLDSVVEIIRYQNHRYDGADSHNKNKIGEDIPIGARILNILLDFDKLDTQGHPVAKICEILNERKGLYDKVILNQFINIRLKEIDNAKILDFNVDGLVAGMILAEDLMTKNSQILITRGNQVTNSLLAKIKNFEMSVGIQQPIKVKDIHSD